ncbi:MAG: DNA glycosylase AlkZ-like family protein, partial [Promethearchaeota archaeon]
NDISWWTGFTKTIIRDALQNIKSQFAHVKITSIKGNFLISKLDIDQLKNITNDNDPAIKLLPELDPYPMGYKDRDRYIDINNYNKIFDRSGNITSTIFLDGVVIGVWDTEETPKPMIKFHLFHPIGNELLNAIYFKAKKIGRFFFEENIDIKECESMIPLTERSAGGFMTPLKNC